MKRLLLVENQGSMVGGGQWGFLQMARELKDKWDICCVCPVHGELVEALNKAELSVEIVPMPALRALDFNRILKSIWQLISLMRSHQADLVYANGSRCMFYAGIAGRLAKIPVTWHVRIAESDGRWDEFLGFLANQVVVISEAVARRFNQAAISEKIKLIYNGIDLEHLQAAERSNLKAELGLEGILIGMVARVTPEKDHLTFLKAAHILKERFKTISFVIVGETPDSDLLTDLEDHIEQLGLNDQALFLGARSDIAGVMKELDVLVHCTHSEGFGRVIIEAMAVGTPVVATEIGGIPEIIKNNSLGRLVPDEDYDKVAAAVSCILRDRNLRQDLSSNTQEYVAERFSLVKHGKEMDQLFRQVIAENT